MKHLEVGVPCPVEPDAKLSKQYEKLSGQVGELASKRRAVAASLPPSSPLSPNPRAELAELEAELDLLRAELPVWKLVPDYIEGCRKARQNAVMVADEIVEQARQHVRAIFDRDFPPNKWPAREALVAYHVANHAIVLGAQDRHAEVRSGDEAGLREAVEAAIEFAEQRYKQLPPMIAIAKERVRTMADDAARREADTKLARELAARQTAEVQAARQRAADEARRRLAAAK